MRSRAYPAILTTILLQGFCEDVNVNVAAFTPLAIKQHGHYQVASSHVGAHLIPSTYTPCKKVEHSTHRISTKIGSTSNNDECEKENSGGLDPNTLMDMDIVLFSLKSDPSSKMQLGAIQEDATLAPLSAWTTECAFDNSIEFLVDEEDRWMEELKFDNVVIHTLLGEDVISYGNRQVGGGKGPGNPHGEESEVVYYVDQEVLNEGSVDIVLKPDLEILW